MVSRGRSLAKATPLDQQPVTGNQRPAANVSSRILPEELGVVGATVVDQHRPLPGKARAIDHHAGHRTRADRAQRPWASAMAVVDRNGAPTGCRAGPQADAVALALEAGQRPNGVALRI